MKRLNDQPGCATTRVVMTENTAIRIYNKKAAIRFAHDYRFSTVKLKWQDVLFASHSIFVASLPDTR